MTYNNLDLRPSVYCNRALFDEDQALYVCTLKIQDPETICHANLCDCYSADDMPDAGRCAVRPKMAEKGIFIYCPAERMTRQATTE